VDPAFALEEDGSALDQGGWKMTRLYYEQGEDVMTLRGAQRKSTQQYLEKVAKLIPGEIIAGYVALIGFIPLVRTTGLHPWLYGASFVLCLILTPVYLNTQAEAGLPKRRHLILSSAAFVVWGYAVSGGIAWPAIHDPAIASILLVAFTLLSGRIPLT
jgi:hypothetical protein